jgi:glyoxylase-like metal-dependent hydrolase (beta-lactamase superfamily II)
VAVPVQVASGVYLVQGARGEVSDLNQGRIGNAGFIVGETGVLAIDTGTSYRHALVLLKAIRSVTDKPVRAVLITHTRQEFLFGAAAFQAQGIAVHMPRQAAALMRLRCARCLQTLQTVLGADAMQGTALVTPDQEFGPSHALPGISREIQLLSYGHSAGPGDVAVLDVQTGVLFAGGLLDNQRVPDIQDSDLDGWRSALLSLHSLPIRAVVPGHGPVGSAAVISHVERYLAQLQARVLELLQRGTSLLDIPLAAELPEFASWDQYQTIHKRNASVLFLRFERAQWVN